MSSPNGTCGAWDAGASNSNGFNTYTEQNCWGDPNCQQTLSANSFGDYRVVANECCDGTVRTAPQDQQLTDNWCASLGNWENLAGGCGGNISEVPVSRLPRLTATYRESFPHNRQTIAQYAWDNWLNNDAGFPNEVMIWVDINGRCNSGSYGHPVGPPVIIGGQTWQPNEYGTGEFIWVLGGDANCAQQASGTVDLLSLLKWMQANGFASPSATLAEVDAVWEICSTGGSPETFTVSNYSLADS